VKEPVREGFAPEEWWSQTESPKAWMSVRDADLYEELLHRLATPSGDLRVLEWGAGRSTSWYTAFLDTLGVRYTWLALEPNREFVNQHLRPALADRPNVPIVEHGDSLGDTVVAVREAVSAAEQNGESVVVVVSFDYGYLRPDLPDHEQDRLADLTDYIMLPTELGLPIDLAVIDGRHRRRCVLAAAGVVGPAGRVILHDAWRKHYQCAWDAWRSGRRFGDEWWIGAQFDTDFADVLPWYAFERHVEAG
jgi:hypothetical protein